MFFRCLRLLPQTDIPGRVNWALTARCHSLSLTSTTTSAPSSPPSRTLLQPRVQPSRPPRRLREHENVSLASVLTSDFVETILFPAMGKLPCLDVGGS